MSILDPRRVFSYFSDHFSLKKSSKGWWIFECPVCDSSDKKMAVHPHIGMVKCWVCNYKSNVIKFVSQMEGVNYHQGKTLLEASSISRTNIDYSNSEFTIRFEDVNLKPPKGFKTILEGEGILGVRARKYLSDRGYNLEELDFDGFGYCNEKHEDYREDYFGYIIIPFKKAGRLVYYQGRDYTGNFLRYKNPSKDVVGVGKADLFFNEDALSIYQEVCVTEGWSDARTLGENGMSSQGWSLSTAQKMAIYNAEVTTHVTFVPDGGVDDSGEYFYVKALRAASDFAQDKVVRVVNLNGLENKDVNSLGMETVQPIIDSTPWMSQTDILRLLMDPKSHERNIYA